MMVAVIEITQEFGVDPARRAAILHPIEGLRSEGC